MLSFTPPLPILRPHAFTFAYLLAFLFRYSISATHLSRDEIRQTPVSLCDDMIDEQGSSQQ